MSTSPSHEVRFPKEPFLEKRDMRRMKWVIYGPPGIGKSTFIAQAKDVLFLTTDGGLSFIKAMHRPVASWFEFKKYVKALCTETPSQYKAVAIDNVDGLFKACRKYICEKRGIEHQSDEPYGKAYDLTSSEFETTLMKIIGLDKYGLFFTSHSVEKEKKTFLTTVNKTVPTMPSQAYKILIPIVDIMAYYGFDGKMTDDGEMSRRMYFQPTEHMDAKDRTKHLPESLVIPDPEAENGFELVESYLVDGGPAKKRKKKVILRKR